MDALAGSAAGVSWGSGWNMRGTQGKGGRVNSAQHSKHDAGTDAQGLDDGQRQKGPLIEKKRGGPLEIDSVHPNLVEVSPMGPPPASVGVDPSDFN